MSMVNFSELTALPVRGSRALSWSHPRLFMLVSCLLAASSAQAATFCAKTGNELNVALDTAAFNQQDDVIKVARGTHISNIQAPGDYQWQFIPNNAEYEYTLTVSGGWNPNDNCATQPTLDPTQTVLDAQYFGPVFQVSLVNPEGFSGVLNISNLTFSRGQSTSAFTASVGIDVITQGAASGAINVDNILVVAGRTIAGSQASRIARFAMNQAGIIKVRNSQFLNNSFTHSSSGGVKIDATNGAIGIFTNNSVSGNTATTLAKGIDATGVVTLSNNASADNVSTVSPSWDFYSNAPTSLTLRNNHFETRGTFNGTPFSETGGTTGDPGWTMIGLRMEPNAVSPLRNSGINTPIGGIPSIDFSGAPRIINTTIDRGAVEAPALTRVGPVITAVNPINNSTTSVTGNVGQTIPVVVQFSSSGAIGIGSTQLTCVPGSGPISITSNAMQTVTAGAPVSPVFVSIVIGQVPQTATLSCTAVRENALNQSFFFTFQVSGDAIFANSFE